MAEYKQTVPQRLAEDLPKYFQLGWQPLFERGIEIQQQVLAEIIALGNHSDYAKDHGFYGINTLEEFKRLVPVSDYEDYKPYINENMRADCGQMIGLETEYYLMTTGTTGQAKFFPETTIGALARQLSIDIWNMVLAQKVAVMTKPDVKMLAIVNCAPIEQALNGKPTLRASGQAAKVLWERAGEMYVFPYEFLEAEMSNDDRDYLTAVYTLKESGFNMLFCNNLAYFGTLLDWIEKCPERMINDIRTGHMSVALSEEDRAKLAPSFQPDSQRADVLQRILKKFGTLPVAEIWTEFCFIGAWLPGTAGRLAKNVMRRLPDNIAYISEGYGASEAMLNIPMEFDAPFGPAAIYAYYFEFLPLNGGEPLAMHEVISGEYYELLITSYSGLYRYNMHDIVRVWGFYGTTANIEFCCKSTEKCLLTNGVLYGFQFNQLIESIEAETKMPLSFFQGLVEEGQLSVVVQPYDEHFQPEVFRDYLRQKIAEKNIDGYRLYVMDKEYCNALFQQMMVNGRTIQTIKLPLMITEKPLAEHIKVTLSFE